MYSRLRRVPYPEIRSLNSAHLNRHTLFLWALMILFSNYIVAFLGKSTEAATTNFSTNADGIGFFQCVAWYAIFRLLLASNRDTLATTTDFLFCVLACLLLLLPTTKMLWLATFCIGAYLFVVGTADHHLRAAGIVLGALAVQKFFMHLFFISFASEILRLETAVLAEILAVMRPGTIWHDNIIIGPDGHGIIMYSGCSSFHNVSLTLLSWISFVKLRHIGSSFEVFAKGLAITGTMILLNFVRLLFMAWNISLYHFWHDGVGVLIFEISASASILMLCMMLTNARGGDA
jgi:hypothetical protein